MLDLRRLRILRELQVRGTLAAVAKALAFSPSSISQQLAVLQREVGVPLVEPAGRGIRLTARGELLATRAAEALDILEAAEAELAGSETMVTGRVRIAVFQSVAHALLPETLTTLRRTHPGLRVEVIERPPEQGLFEVAAGDLDLAVAEQYPGHTRAMPPALDRVPLAADAIRLAVGPEDGSRRTIVPDLADMREAAWVMEPLETASRQWAVQLCRAAGFEPDVRFEEADLVAQMRLIASGNAVGLLPGLMTGGSATGVRLGPLPGEPRREIFSSARRAGAAHPAVAAVRSALAAADHAANRHRWSRGGRESDHL